MTRESCIAYLTGDTRGPELDPVRLQIGTLVTFDGRTEIVYEGMTLETICDSAVVRRQELLARDQAIVRLQAENELLAAQGKEDHEFRTKAEHEFVRRHPYAFAKFAGLELFLIVFLTIYAWTERWIRGFFRWVYESHRKSRSRHSMRRRGVGALSR